MSESKQKIPLLAYLIFIGTGLAIFFLAAFLVVLVRTKTASRLVMPEVVGQNYIDVHNELTKLRLKVQLETKRYPDKNDGEILYQSIPAGKVIEAGSKLYLTLNVSVDRVVVPELKGLQLNAAKALLSKVLSGDVYVQMEIGGITYVPATEGIAPETVIDQIPEAGKITNTREKIYLLVTESKVKESSFNFNPENQPFPFIAFALSERKKNFSIKEIIPLKSPKENGLIQKVEQMGENYNFTVNYYESDPKPLQGYEKFVFKPDTTDNYTAKLYSEASHEKPIKKLFNHLKIQEGISFPFIFYRNGNVKIEIEDATKKIVKIFRFEGDLKK
ncbi:MAG: PASTA domain-containing protein [Leptospiraceae bacterium]|nr:PASTA domain-containing protein [Leptospiraceae bacterium]